jgi:UDP-N-acetylmuramyl pentapeptide phosphotransferase/UDP-N-acetylglucosamine-1-phosphate transferase
MSASHPSLLAWLATAVVAALMAYGGIAAVIGWLQERALAKPNARSSHTVPTPQGGGVAVMAAALLAAGLALGLTASALPGGPLYTIAVAIGVVVLTIVSFADDMRGLSVATRFAAQIVVLAAVLALMPAEMRVVPGLPLWFERLVLFGIALWFVNLFNFMDGIDLISTVETVAITLGITLLAALGLVDPAYGLVAIALLGAMLGFAPWNVPPARLFLGDAGAIPIGFLLSILLIHVAAAAPAAAAILPLYYFADATITLLRRLARGERVWEAHRTHFYQQATSNGLSVRATVGRIAALDAVLVALATVAAVAGHAWVDALAIVAATVAVAATLRGFTRGRRR